MPSRRDRKRETGRRQRQPPPPTTQPISPPVKAEAEAIDSTDGETRSQTQIQPTEPRLLSAWLQVWLPIIFSGLVVVVIITHAFYYKKQWEAMNRQIGLMRESLTEGVTTREVENRAYITAKEISLTGPVTSPEPIKVTVLIENIGKTPALNVKNTLYVSVFRMDLPKKEGEPIGTPLPPSVLPPNRPLTLEVVGRRLEPQEVALLSEPGIKLYAWGAVEYDDFFGKHHRTEYCFASLSIDSTRFASCLYGNTMD